MLSLNMVMVAGNLTRDPETRYTNSGQAICSFGLAVNRRFSSSTGEQREEVCFLDIEVWGRQAELCQQYLHKGRNVLVEGRLKYDQWEDRQTGQKRSTIRITGNRVHFLDRDDNAGGGGDDGGGGRGYGGQQQRGGGWQQQQPQQAPPRQAPAGGRGAPQPGGWQQQRPQRQQPPPPPFPEGNDRGDPGAAPDTAEPFIDDDDSIDDIPF